MTQSQTPPATTHPIAWKGATITAETSELVSIIEQIHALHSKAIDTFGRVIGLCPKDDEAQADAIGNYEGYLLDRLEELIRHNLINSNYTKL